MFEWLKDKRCSECGTKLKDATGGWFVIRGLIHVFNRSYVPCSLCGEPKGLHKDTLKHALEYKQEPPNDPA